jgi:hypothetical protein
MGVTKLIAEIQTFTWPAFYCFCHLYADVMNVLDVLDLL